MSKGLGRLRLGLALSVICLLLTTIGYVCARGDLSQKEARRLIAHLAGIELSSDAVHVKDISSLGGSTVVVAQVETAFRFEKDEGGKWRVAEIRTGNNRWEEIDMIVRAVNAEKAERARAELEAVATALEAFRRERGFYAVADSEAALVDQLSPRYLPHVIRVDPWHRPYLYEGTRDSFVLRSTGVDGKANTADDLVLAKRAQD